MRPDSPTTTCLPVLSWRDLPAPPEGKQGWPWAVESEPLPAAMPDGKPWPLFSITVPSYNQGDFLEETIRSVLLQGYPAVELFIMDGGSTDSSRDILERYTPWISAWVSEKDRGQSHAINKGWQRSNGELIAYLNSDDFYLPDALRQVAQAWGYDRQVAMLAGGVAFVNAGAELLKTGLPRLAGAGPLDLSLLDITDWYVPQQASFFDRAHLDDAGRWLREDLHFVMDRELMYRLCRLGRVVFVDEVLAADRLHAGAKRQKDRLRLYREDALAMQYCQWGSPADRRRRNLIARHRLAQGYWMNAEDAPPGAKKALNGLRAMALRPAYLKQVPAIKSVLNVLRNLRGKFRS